MSRTARRLFGLGDYRVARMFPESPDLLAIGDRHFGMSLLGLLVLGLAPPAFFFNRSLSKIRQIFILTHGLLHSDGADWILPAAKTLRRLFGFLVMQAWNRDAAAASAFIPSS